MSNRRLFSRVMFVFVAVVGAVMVGVAAANGLLLFTILGLVLLALGLVGIFYFTRRSNVP